MPLATCPLCEAGCGLVVDADGGQIRSVRGDPDDPFSHGYLCPKASALIDLHSDPDRLRAPVVRDGSHWREVPWDDAFERAASGLRRVRAQHGRDAVALYYGNPVAHNLGLLTHALPFGPALATRNVYSASSADQLPQMLVSLRMFGHLALIPVPDLDRTDLLVIVGANPLVSNGSLMTAPDMRRRLAAIRRRGGRVVVIDPRRTETAAAADEHVPIRPGTDALLLAAMLQVIGAEQLDRASHLDAVSTNREALGRCVRELSPERVAARTGVSDETIRRLAREFAGTPRAACYGRVGMCTQRYGTLASWLAMALNIVTGHLDRPGGMMFTTPAVDIVALTSRLGLRGSFGTWRSRVRGLPEFGGHPPIAALADEIATPGKGQVRALVTIAGNPALSAPNGARLERALATLDHVVAIDPYLNETTRHAHVILPPAPPLTRSHYGLAVNAFAVRNVARYTPAVHPRGADQRHDWEIVSELATRLFVPAVLRPAARFTARIATPERLLDGALRIGPHRLNLRTLRNAPHGIDLGSLEPERLPKLLATATRQIDLAPPDFVAEALASLPIEADRDDVEELVLIGRRQLRSNNSWMHNAPRLMKGPARCTLLMHPDDAHRAGVADGEDVRVASESGEVTARVELSTDMQRGVVSLPHGWGHRRAGVRARIATAQPGASANDLTSDEFLDTLSGNAAFNGVPVTVTPLRQAVRPLLEETSANSA